MSEGESKENVAPAPKSGGRYPRGWLLLLALVAGLNFVLGLLVGRGTPPLRFDILALERELASLREAEVQAELKRFRIAMEGSGDHRPLDFFQTLDQDDKPRPAPARVAKNAAANTRKPQPAPAGTTAAAEGKKTDSPEVPAKPGPVNATVRSTPPASGRGPLVQVAALRESESADRIVARLRALGFPVRSVAAKTDQGTWYRVRVGPFADRQAAGEARDRLSRLNYDAIVVDP